MNKGFGVTVTVTQPGELEPKTAPLVVVARDELDAELVAATAAGPNARAETLRELTDDEVRLAQGEQRPVRLDGARDVDGLLVA